MYEEFITLSIYEVEYDQENPRIRGALEKYGGNLTAERIYFALRSSSDEGARSSSGFHALKISIRAHEGISERIKVIERNGKYVCIDGNSRLAIYRDFAKNDKNGTWEKIPCVLLRNSSPQDVEKIRMTAHILSARPWPAYEKAKYLKYLYFEKFFSYSELIALCGGNKSEIERQMDAFDDMNEYYKDKVPDDEFRIDRYSGFVELQKQGIKEAIFDANFELSDFGDWIHKGNIRTLADVRVLPRVLKDEQAKEKLVTGGVNSIKEAVRIIDNKIYNNQDKELPISLLDADLNSLAVRLKGKLAHLTLDEIEAFRDNEILSSFEQLSRRLSDILNYVRE